MKKKKKAGNRKKKKKKRKKKKKKSLTEHEQNQPYHQHHQFEHIDFGWCNGGHQLVYHLTTNFYVVRGRHQRGAREERRRG